MKISKCSLLLTLALSSTLFITGCDKEVAEGKEAAVVENEVQAMPVSDLTAQNISSAFFAPFIASGEISEEQSSCLKNVDYKKLIPETEKFYKEKFTEDELNELNEFYKTESGKQLNAYGLQQILMAAGIEIPQEEMIKIDIEDMKNAMELMQKPAFKKYQEINGTENELIQSLVPIFNEELKNCKIDAQI